MGIVVDDINENPDVIKKVKPALKVKQLFPPPRHSLHSRARFAVSHILPFEKRRLPKQLASAGEEN
jgi:hypothetical protein